MERIETFPEGYTRKDLTVSAGKANIYALFFALPFIVIFCIIYWFLWNSGYEEFSLMEWVNHYQTALWLSPLVLFALLVVGVVVHELIHGITWAFFATGGYRSITYGIMWKYLTPYCHCKEPLLLKYYCLGGAMPAIVLGFLPSIFGIITGNFLLFLFGLWFTLAAGGDFMILWMLRNSSKDSLVQDHPDKIGCYLLVKNIPAA